MCKNWCIGVMVYFSIKFGSNCTLIHHYTFLDRHPLKLALLLNNNIIYLIILLLKKKVRETEGMVCVKIGVLV